MIKGKDNRIVNIIILFSVVCLQAGCRTTGGIVVAGETIETQPTDNLGTELQSQQAAIAETGGIAVTQSEQLAKDSHDLVQAVTDADVNKPLQQQAKSISDKADRLQKTITDLNSQLKAERDITVTWQESYNALKTKNESAITKLTGQTVQLQTDYDTEKLSHQKTKNQRNILFCITLVLAAGIAGYIVLRMKRC